MATQFPDIDWFEEWRDLLVNDEEIPKYSKGWGVEFDGSFVYEIKADDSLPETKYFYLDIEEDQVHSVKELDDPDDIEHGFVYSGNYEDWVELTSGELDPVNALMGGIFDLEGEMQEALAYNDMANRMFNLTTEINTEYKY